MAMRNKDLIECMPEVYVSYAEIINMPILKKLPCLLFYVLP